MRRQRFERQQQLWCHGVVVERFSRRRESLRQATKARVPPNTTMQPSDGSQPIMTIAAVIVARPTV